MLHSASIGFGDTLRMNFFVEDAKLDAGQRYYAVITKSGCCAVIPQSEWERCTGDDGESLWRFGLTDLSAKEMSDEIKVQLFLADGTPAGPIYTDSLRSYAMRMLEQVGLTDALQTTLVDMLNYGAAAQNVYHYNTADLANRLLTTAQKGYGSAMPVLTNRLSSGMGYVHTMISLEGKPQMRFIFENITSAMHAMISYIDHNGNEMAYTIDGSEWGTVGGNASVDVALSVLDVSQLVRCRVFDGNMLVGEIEDSIESCVARMDSPDTLYDSLMKFAASARSALALLDELPRSSSSTPESIQSVGDGTDPA